MTTRNRFALFRAEPDPAHIDVPHGDRAFRVAVKRRPTARRFTLRVSNATGDIVLTLPEKASMDAARRFAEAHGGWIATRVAKLPDRVAFAPEASIPFRGEPHRIVPWTSVPGVARATLDEAGRPIIAVAGERAHLARRVKDFLKREAARDLDRAVAHHTAALGIPARKITLRDTTSRWGSCSSRGHLSFSWRLVMAPPFVLDYLAAHEVAHLKEMNHSHRFWALLHRLCPRTEDAELWLKRHGSSLHRYG